MPATFPSKTVACLAMIALVLAPRMGAAAEIKSVAARDARVTITINGDIVPGDTEVFKAAVKQANDAGKAVGNLRLNSLGGNLLEGVKLADAVRYAKISTNVGKSATCASACFLVFAAGSEKFVSYGARVGVHGASDQSGNETVQSGAATVSMARVAKELGVPAAIIGRMVVTPPNEMVWLSPHELQSMGTTMVGKPSQVASPQGPAETQTGEPLQLQTSPSQVEPQIRQPTAKAAVTQSWDAMVSNAIDISSSQNGGTPTTLRSCQPQSRVCTSGVMFKLDGVNTVLLSRQNIDGKVIEREICTFNRYGDMRSCVDWDTKETHRDMKDSKGEWSKVAD